MDIKMLSMSCVASQDRTHNPNHDCLCWALVQRTEQNQDIAHSNEQGTLNSSGDALDSLETSHNVDLEQIVRMFVKMYPNFRIVPVLK